MRHFHPNQIFVSKDSSLLSEQVRLGLFKVSLSWVKLGKVRLGYVWLGKIRYGHFQVRLS